MDQFEELKEKYKDDREKRYEQDERFRRLVDLMDEYLETSVSTRGTPERDLNDAAFLAVIPYYTRHGWESRLTDPRELQ